MSVCTVSRYLNHKITVRADTKERLERAIEELGYVPNQVAQSLKRSSTDNVAVILPRINTSYYSDMTGGISLELAKRGFHLFIYEMENLRKSEREVLQMMRESMAAGVISIGMSDDMSFRDSLDYLVDHGIPAVYVNRQVPPQRYPVICPDFLRVGGMAAGHLIERGKRRLAILRKARADDELIHHHEESFREAAAMAGLPEPVALESAPGLVTSSECLDRLSSGEIDGVFVLNELMAAGVVKGLTARGVRIPEDIAVLGFGDSIISEITDPELSCIDLQNYELGVRSAQLILKQIEGAPVPQTMVLKPSLIQRRST